MTSNPTQQTPDHQPGGPQLAWRGAPQPPWPGPQPPWPAPARPDPPADRSPVQPAIQDPQDGQQPAWEVTRSANSPAADDERLAAIGYLGVPILAFVVPLVVCLLRRRSDAVRQHAIQALNLSLTMLLYGICILIAGAVLALDSTGVAMVVVIMASAALWLAVVGYAIVAGLSAYQGGFRRIPGWLCATIVR
jgi:uncharacterized Tic20 family protein